MKTPFLRPFSGRSGGHFYTADAGEVSRATPAYGAEGNIGFIWAEMMEPGTVPLFRMYSAAAKDHFYTTGWDEEESAIGSLGYANEGYCWLCLSISHQWEQASVSRI